MRHVGFQSSILRFKRVFSVAWATAQLKTTLGGSGKRPVVDRMSAFRQDSEFSEAPESQGERSEFARPRCGCRKPGSIASATKDIASKPPQSAVEDSRQGTATDSGRFRRIAICRCDAMAHNFVVFH